MDVAAFLAARLDEDEAVARAAIQKTAGANVYGSQDLSGKWYATTDGLYPEVPYGGGPFALGSYGYLDEETGAHIARWDPARVLAEIAAKRLTLADHQTGRGVDWKCENRDHIQEWQCERAGCSHTEWRYCEICDDVPPCRGLRLLAAPYADHPDYDPAWAADAAH